MDDLERLSKLTAELSGAGAELSAFFERSRKLVVELGADGRFKRVNRRWERTLGYSISEMLASSWTDLVHLEDLAATGDAFAEAAKGRTVRLQNRMRHRSGSYHDLAWTVTRGDPGGVIVAVVKDVTQRHEARRTRRGTGKRPRHPREYGLTQRERATLSLIAEGKTNKEIATVLKISPATVSTHVASILAKMNATSRAEAAARAVREALVS